MSDIESIRIVLSSIQELIDDGYLPQTTAFSSSIESLSRVEERTLPELPDGWSIINITFFHDVMYNSDCYTSMVQKIIKPCKNYVNTRYIKKEGEGKTPRLAVLAAIKEIGE